MANNQKTKRTEVKDLTATEKDLTKQEMDKVQGGASLNTSKSNIKNNPLGAPAPPPTGTAIGEPGVK